MDDEIRKKLVNELGKCGPGYITPLWNALNEGGCMDRIKPLLQTIKACKAGTALRERIRTCNFSNDELRRIRELVGDELADWLNVKPKKKELSLREQYEKAVAHIAWHLKQPLAHDLNHLKRDIDVIKDGRWGELPTLGGQDDH